MTETEREALVRAERDELRDALKWERVAFEDRRKRLELAESERDTARQSLLESEALREQMRGALQELVRSLDSVFGRPPTVRQEAALHVADAALSASPSDALKAHDAEVERKAREDERAKTQRPLAQLPSEQRLAAFWDKMEGLRQAALSVAKREADAFERGRRAGVERAQDVVAGWWKTCPAGLSWDDKMVRLLDRLGALITTEASAPVSSPESKPSTPAPTPEAPKCGTCGGAQVVYPNGIEALAEPCPFCSRDTRKP